MRIGIVTPIAMFPLFSQFYDEEKREILRNMPGNDHGPVPSLLAKGLIEAGNFVRIFTFGDMDAHFISNKVEIFVCNQRSGLLNRFSDVGRGIGMSNLIRNHMDDLDILHAHWTYKCALAILPFVKDLPCFCTIRDIPSVIRKYLPNKGGTYWRVKSMINALVYHEKELNLIANSPYTQHYAESRTGRLIECIMNPIDEKFMINDEIKRNDQLKIVSIMSSLDERKNPTTLLHAFQIVLNKNPNAHLYFIVNSRDLESSTLYAQWSVNNLLKNVTFYKCVPHNELPKIIDECKIMVCPSKEETFGNIIIESMARKIPVIAGRNSGAIPFLLDHEKYGYLCDIENPISIANTILAVDINYDEAITKSNLAYENLKKNYTLVNIVNQHIKIYERYNKNN